MRDKTKQENQIKTGDLVFVKGPNGEFRDVGIAVWFRDPMYCSHLFLADWNKRDVRLVSLSSISDTKVLVRPGVFFTQVVTKMLDNDRPFNTSLNWVVDGLNQKALEIGPNHTPSSLYEVLVKGLLWKVIG